MKRFLIILICIAISGCAYNKSTNIKASGDKVKVPIQGIGTIEGENISAIISRQVNYSMPKGKQIVQESITGGYSNNQEATVIIE